MENLSSSELSTKIRTIRSRIDLSDGEIHELFSYSDELLARKERRIDDMEHQLEKPNETVKNLSHTQAELDKVLATTGNLNATMPSQRSSVKQPLPVPVSSGKKPAHKKDVSQDRKRKLENTSDPAANNKTTKSKRAESLSTQPEQAMPTADTENDQQPSSQEPAPSQPTAKKPPPIHLRTKDGWPELQHQLHNYGAKVISAKNLRDSIQVQVASADHFRAATRRLDALQVPYHTYALPEEKTIRAVVKGIPEGISCEEIQQELDELLPIISVTCLKKRADRAALPVVLVQLSRNGGEKIYELSRLMGLVVTVEPHRRKHQVGQCFRCQGFGHSARCCRADPRCVKCGKAHLSYTCRKPRKEAATCANCGGDHPANYKGCPKFPKTGHHQAVTAPRDSRPQPSQSQANRPKPNPVVPGRTYASNLPETSNVRTQQRQSRDPATGDLQSASLINEVIGAFANLADELKKSSPVFDKLSLILDAVNKLSRNV